MADLTNFQKTVFGERGWKINAIKNIYGTELMKNSNVPESDIEKYYVNSLIYKNAIEVPIAVVGKDGKHAIKNPTTEASNVQDTAKVSQVYNRDILSYYKVVQSKDIDWGNAYLQYATGQSKMEGGFNYQKINSATGKPYEIEYFCNSYSIPDNVKNTVSTSYDMINALNYVMNKLKATWFMVNVVKDQREQLSIFNSMQNNNS